MKPGDPEQGTKEAPSDPEQGTKEAPSDPEEETQEASSDTNEETRDEAEPVVGSTDLEGPVVPALWKLTISGNLPPKNVIVHVESTVACRYEMSSAAFFSADDQRCRRGRRRGEYVGVRRWGLSNFAGEGGGTGANSEGRVTRTENRQQAMDSPEMEEWRKFWRKWKCKVTRPK